MQGKRRRPTLERELERVAKWYFLTAEELKTIKETEDKAYHQWIKCRDEAREKEKDYARALKTLLEMNDRVNAKREKEVSKFPDNVIPMEQRT